MQPDVSAMGETPDCKKYKLNKSTNSFLSHILFAIGIILVIIVFMTGQLLLLIALYPLFIVSIMPMNSDQWIIIGPDKVSLWQQNLGKKSKMRWSVSFKDIDHIRLIGSDIRIILVNSGHYVITPINLKGTYEGLKKLQKINNQAN